MEDKFILLSMEDDKMKDISAISFILSSSIDKFILLSMEDDKMKDIAEILSNKTSKKIINFLSDVKEASQKDISEGLKLPINTVDYNIKNMIRTGLIEETKNFFWSAKGRKIYYFLRSFIT